MKQREKAKATEKLFYVDENRINIVKRGLEQALSKINEINGLVLNALGELSHDQMTNLPKDGVKVLWDEVRSRYQFPNASDDFNMKVLGIDVRPIIEKFNHYQRSWRNFGSDFDHAEFIYKNGKYHLADNQPSINKHYYYLDTPEKVEFVESIERLKEVLFDLKNKNYAAWIGESNRMFRFVVFDRDMNLHKEAIAKQFKHLS